MIEIGKEKVLTDHHKEDPAERILANKSLFRIYVVSTNFVSSHIVLENIDTIVNIDGNIVMNVPQKTMESFCIKYVKSYRDFLGNCSTFSSMVCRVFEESRSLIRVWDTNTLACRSDIAPSSNAKQ